MGLLEEWGRAAGNWDTGSAPFMLPADEGRLRYFDKAPLWSWEEARQAPDFYVPDKDTDRRFHLGLLPVPFMGDLRNASIYVLMTNPGVKPDDYRESEEDAFRDALLSNLKQEWLDGSLPFPHLDPRFDWHDGFVYWDKERGLRRTIVELARVRGISEPEARALLCDKLVVIQLVPYHSGAGPTDSDRPQDWPSARLAGEFVRDAVVPRVRSREAVLLVMRRLRSWGQYLPSDLSGEHGLFRPVRGTERSAPMGPTSRAGRAILRHLGDTS